MSLLSLFLFFWFLRAVLAAIVAFFCGLFDPATWESASTNPVKPAIRPRSCHQLNR